MAESEEELKRLLMKKVKEEESEKVGLKSNIQKLKIVASGPVTLWQIDGENREGNGTPLQYSCLKNPYQTEESGRLQSMGSPRVGHD